MEKDTRCEVKEQKKNVLLPMLKGREGEAYPAKETEKEPLKSEEDQACSCLEAKAKNCLKKRVVNLPCQMHFKCCHY